MNRILMCLAVLAALMASSCAQKQTSTNPEAGKRATVTMRDGTKTAGTLTKSSNTEITIAGDDNITRTIPMDQVRLIEYVDVAATAPAAPAPAARSAAPAPVAKPAAPAPAANPVSPVEKPQAAAPLGNPQQHQIYEVPKGAPIAVRTDEAIDSATAKEGQVFGGEVTKDVLDVNGELAIPKGSSAQIVIMSASKGGRFRGASDLTIDLQSVTIGGRRYSIETEEVSQKGRQGIGANRRTATFTGAGAAIGAIVGAIAGGGKGAAIGAASGAGAGALTQILTKGKSIQVPAETILTFKLDAPLRITAEK